MANSPEAQRLIDQRAQERLERMMGTRPMFDTAWTIGDHRLAEPGAECWSRTEGDVSDRRQTASEDPRGGIILEITTDPDNETGELNRAYRCFDYTAPLWNAVVVLTEPMVEPDSFSAPDWNRIKGCYRRLCREVGKKLEGRHEATREELDMVHTAFLLASILRRTVT